jgi:predicted nucleic acid-binding protein
VAAFQERLAKYSKVGLDSSIFIYQFEAHPNYSQLTQAIFDEIEFVRLSGIASVITLMELTVRPWQLKEEEVVREYEAYLVNFPNLALIAIDRVVARKAAQLRAAYQLRPADALQVAACLSQQGEAFITNDHRLARLGDVLDILVLDDFLQPNGEISTRTE